MLFLQLRGRLHQRFVHLLRAAIFHHSSEWVKWCLLLFFISQISYSQERLGRVTSDFRISSDSTPSTFVQKNIRLFPKTDSGFVAAWEDDRGGEKSFYAQRFDASGNKIGGNYKTFSNEAISFLKDGSSLSIKQTISPWEDYCYIEVQGYFSDSSGVVFDSLSLVSSFLPGCGNLYQEVEYYYANSDDSYYFLFRNMGKLNIWRYDKYGHVDEAMILITTGYESIRSASISVHQKGDYLLTFYKTFINGQNEIYGTFVNSTDSILAQPHPLGLCVDTLYNRNSYDHFPLIKSCLLSDSTYEVFATRNDSALLEYRAFDLTGNPLMNTMQIPVMINGYDHFTLYDITISTAKQNSVSLMVEGIYSLGNQDDKYTVLLRFDSTGMEVGVPAVTEGWLKNDGGYNISLNDHDYIVASDDDDDVYLKHYHDLIPEDSMKVNDDSLGSNDEKPYVTPAGEDRFFVTWEAAKKYYGQMINLQGEKLGDQRILEGKTVKCITNDICANVWSFRSDNQKNIYGFTLYNSSWEIVKRETVMVSESLLDYSGYVSIEKLTDTTMVFVAYKNSMVYSLTRYSSLGQPLGEREFTAHSITTPNIFLTNDNSFWLSCGGSLQQYSDQIDTISIQYNLNNPQLYLDGYKFLTIEPQCYVEPIYYCTNSTRINDVTNNWQSQLIPIGDKVYKLGSSRFLTFINGDQIYAKTFFNDGRVDHNSVKIHSEAGGYKKEPSVAVQNGYACFVWAEVRSPGRGYDIFGSVMPISSLLDVPDNDATLLPQEFTLYQNYPNPFNPSTMIRYDIPVQGNVNISVFDVLGREVTRLVNGIQQAGEHWVTWNAEGVPSGVYFYRVTTNNFTETKKLLLMR